MSKENERNLLPYDNTCMVVYDNDEALDVYTDDLVMALASAGDIKLMGMITSSSIQPYNKYVPAFAYEKMRDDRMNNYIFAKEAGFTNIPEPIAGPCGNLEKPQSGKIEDTLPIDSPGTRLIVELAKQTTYEKPLVVAMGGTATLAASAYLMDNSIADKVVFTFLEGTMEGMETYNGWADGWASYILLEKLRLVVFPFERFAPHVQKSRLTELPESRLRQFMIDKYHIYAQIPKDHDLDSEPVISIMRKDYVQEIKKVSVGYIKDVGGIEVPMYKEDPNGRGILIVKADRDVATEEWWRAMKNPKAWGK